MVKSDCIKTFDIFELQIMVLGNIFGIKVYLESFI